jgi:hypothetical protein
MAMLRILRIADHPELSHGSEKRKRIESLARPLERTRCNIPEGQPNEVPRTAANVAVSHSAQDIQRD